MNFYVYRIDLLETGEFYFGSRGCKCKPIEDDKYLGSMSAWKPNKKKLTKTIIKSDFINRAEAYLYESKIIKDNFENKLNRNYNIPGEHFNTCGMVVVKDKQGHIFTVPIDNHQFLSGEFIAIGKGKVVVKDEKSNIFKVDVNDPRYLNGELTSIMLGFKHTDFSKKKMSNARKGIVKSEEHKRKIAKSHIGLKNSVETRKKISISQSGKKLSEEHKNKIRIKSSLHRHTKETKEKIGKAHKNKKLNTETKEKIKIAWKLRETIKCPHCNIESNNLGNMNRWHFNNCKKLLF